MNFILTMTAFLCLSGCAIDVTPEPVASPDWKHLESYVKDSEQVDGSMAGDPNITILPGKPYISTDAK